MIVQAEVDKNGVVKVNDPAWRGKKITLALLEQSPDALEKETDWEAIEKILEKVDKMDFPRKTHQEIMKELRDIRG